MSNKQKTIAQEVSIQGIGLHTGLEINITLKPALENTGFVFKRIDLEETPTIKADVDYVISTERSTTIGKDGFEISTIEHLLSGLYGSDIDNVVIEIDNPEVPILDGSAKPWLNLIENAGKVVQDANREYFEITTPIFFEDGDRNTTMMAVPCDDYHLTVMVDFSSGVLPAQFAEMKTIEEFPEQIGHARTFVFLHELEYLLNNNLIKGGDLSNAIVFVDKLGSQATIDRLKKEKGIENVIIKEGSILDSKPLRYSNEPARHKLLDVVGDLALVGKKIKGHIYATRPGHKTNVEFAKLLKSEFKKKKMASEMPEIDFSKNPLYNIHDILKILPHRYPFILVDKVIEMNENRVVGTKNVTLNEPFFTGHFPENPVMPGVMIIEAMAQVGGILVLNTVEDPKMYTPYFMKVDKVKFKRKVIPGDTLVFIVELVSPIRRGICHISGKAYVDGLVVMEGEMMAQIVKQN
jgi:UDP-3-O-[3-hydroxymyristoyl] N-acetylglucosamine deacetylase/3-hydroxyacyl-[acyl-carrier-protein] dehydratase